MDIPYLRLVNQQIIHSQFKSPKEIVDWMGAMQAQDYNMARLAVGVRLPGSTDKSIESAIDRGEIIRTHALRPTWHFVSPDDIYWILELSAPQIKATQKTRDKLFNLSEYIYEKTNFVIENALQGGEHLSREELATELETANIATDLTRIYNFLMRAEIDGIICSGRTKNNNITYALLEERVPRVKKLPREEALSRLALKYFTSHGPATLQDFVWWSGLSVTESRQGLESIKAKMVSETIDNQTFWFSNSLTYPEPDRNSVCLLPAYDEFIISYRDRTAALPFEMHKKAVSNNGIFRPVIVVNGQVTGIWKRTTQKDKIKIETSFFQPVSKTIMTQVEEAAIQIGDFMNKKVELSIVK